MENNNKRIIFDVPEGTTPGKIISDIFQKFNIDDNVLNSKTSKINIVGKAAKNLFREKISEENLLKLFQDELGLTKDNALLMVKDIKDKLIPFTKEITITSDESNKAEDIKPPISFTDIMEENPLVPSEQIINENISTPPKKLPKVKKPITEIQKSKGSDKYREPVE